MISHFLGQNAFHLRRKEPRIAQLHIYVVLIHSTSYLKESSILHWWFINGLCWSSLWTSKVLYYRSELIPVGNDNRVLNLKMILINVQCSNFIICIPHIWFWNLVTVYVNLKKIKTNKCRIQHVGLFPGYIFPVRRTDLAHLTDKLNHVMGYLWNPFDPSLEIIL